MNQIANYIKINEMLATSGQPTAADFKAMAQAGYQVVINLALPTSTNALSNEGAIVAGLGMAYIHIPVEWDAPKLDDVLLFFAVMQAVTDCRVWVHCAMNMRVSCFLYLYQKHALGLPEEQSRAPMDQIWQPAGVWQQFGAWRELVETTHRHFGGTR